MILVTFASVLRDVSFTTVRQDIVVNPIADPTATALQLAGEAQESLENDGDVASASQSGTYCA